MTALYFAVALLFVAVMALALAFFVLARQIGVLFERIAPMGALMNDSGPKVGDLTPAFTLNSLTGGAVHIGRDKEKAMLVFFLSPTCPVCKKLLPILRSVKASEKDWLDVVLASDGEEEKHQRFIQHVGLQDFPYVLSTELGLGYRVSRLPFAVLMDKQGVIRSKGLINSREQLESLFNAMEMGVGSVQSFLEQHS
ncbi:methylamine dehydrogenase accessory protein MauD [Thalassolituus hydrocarboniclasticus]|uniref:Methylamine utilization protein MauD n=1 Tax=Thalassolituus hydrocarboniclasticus TaxID=2742796 RepID=A0ABY6A4N7_9GAMM|nr:methylamine dehydrogenase accessory protein MauD [Thalassolituus hydrocarboniclasticus]UXD86117.1 methylamine dehydrogenase accessory protein MauD [Thalassolituus hydrocarboniclasticus]